MFVGLPTSNLDHAKPKPMRLRKLFLIIFSVFISAQANAQQAFISPKPKLVVGLVIDQMRWDYLIRFKKNFTAGGFNRLMREGYSFDNVTIPYTPTYTAPGHSCIYTGSIPAIHGVVGNNWYDRNLRRHVNCTDDSTVMGVGSMGAAGKMSPTKLLASTIGDELRLSNDFRSRVFSVGLKDRGAIFPAGHSANAAFWFDNETGEWISSTHYMKSLPQYVNEFNALRRPDDYLKQPWIPLLAANSYTQSDTSRNVYESPIPGLPSTHFPHDLSGITTGKYESFRHTPAAVSYSFDFAKQVLVNEKLGKGAVTDLFALSISSTDLVGHQFGPRSMEIEDCYVRLDRDLADFLGFLDGKVGKGNYLFFLSSDHAVADIPAYLQQHNIPAGTFNSTALRNALNKELQARFGITDGVKSIINFQVYLDPALDSNSNNEAIVASVITALEKQPYINSAVATKAIGTATIPQMIRERMINGYHPKRSGQVQFILDPQVYPQGKTGSTHGSWNPHDSHIPLIFFGCGITKGHTNREVYMTDIAPTLAAILQIQMPNGSIGKPLPEVIK